MSKNSDTPPIQLLLGSCAEEDGPSASLVRKPEDPRQGGLPGGEVGTEPFAHFGPAHLLGRPELVHADVTGRGEIPSGENKYSKQSRCGADGFIMSSGGLLLLLGLLTLWTELTPVSGQDRPSETFQDDLQPFAGRG
ncbi:hypothetical protein NXF25_009879 [Crotalus adamanteus]|uniref:Uncharacterized protein n=1 Tax=Crotalus adamanteus TaxID=8729 RepID=A0AAW1BSR0_CROAD